MSGKVYRGGALITRARRSGLVVASRQGSD